MTASTADVCPFSYYLQVRVETDSILLQEDDAFSTVHAGDHSRADKGKGKDVLRAPINVGTTLQSGHKREGVGSNEEPPGKTSDTVDAPVPIRPESLQDDVVENLFTFSMKKVRLS